MGPALALALPSPRVSDGAKRLNAAIVTRDAPTAADYVYILKDLFTSINGSWEPSSHPYSIPQWARDAYLRPAGAPDVFDDAGGDHHLFARVEDGHGLPLTVDMRFWSTDGENLIRKSTGEKRSGWTNLPIWASFVPERGERGPWNFAPAGSIWAIHRVDGGGLPANEHVSLFAVWQRVAMPTEPVTPPSQIDVTVTRPDTLIRIHATGTFKIEVIHA